MRKAMLFSALNLAGNAGKAYSMLLAAYMAGQQVELRTYDVTCLVPHAVGYPSVVVRKDVDEMGL